MASGILKDLADGAKRLGEIKKEFSDLEFNERILELRQLLLSAQVEIVDLQAEKIELAKEIETFKAKKDQSETLIEIEGFKYDLIDGEPRGLPYCPTCETRDEKLYRLGTRNDEYSKCPNCETMHNAAANGRVNSKTPPRTFDSAPTTNYW